MEYLGRISIAALCSAELSRELTRSQIRTTMRWFSWCWICRDSGFATPSVSQKPSLCVDRSFSLVTCRLRSIVQASHLWLMHGFEGRSYCCTYFFPGPTDPWYLDRLQLFWISCWRGFGYSCSFLCATQFFGENQRSRRKTHLLKNAFAAPISSLAEIHDLIEMEPR